MDKYYYSIEFNVKQQCKKQDPITEHKRIQAILLEIFGFVQDTLQLKKIINSTAALKKCIHL